MHDNENRLIFHVDVNSAFLSWSSLKLLEDDPNAVDLRTVPSAVGGDVKTRHGVITSRSLPAKKYGVRSGEPVVKALQKCPQLILVKGDFQTYRKYSHAFIDILRSYSDIVEQVSIDEAFIDFTGAEEKYAYLITDTLPWPICLAEAIKNQVRDTLGFTVNVGISSNKLLAKMASDFQKPDRIHTLFPEEVPEKMWPLPIGDLFGCGPATAARLNDLGFHTIGEIAHSDEAFLISLLGEKGGSSLFRSANGISHSAVSSVHEEAKGYSNETTTSFDLFEDNYDEELPSILDGLCESVARRLQRDKVFASTIGVSVKTDDFRRRSKQTTLSSSTNSFEDLSKYTALLMRELCFGEGGIFEQGAKVRLVGVSATKLDHGEYRQISLLDWMAAAENARAEEAAAKAEAERLAAEAAAAKELAARKQAEAEKKQAEAAQKKARLDEMMKKIQSKFGSEAIEKGAHMGHPDNPDNPHNPGEE